MGWVIRQQGRRGETRYYGVYRDLQGRQRSAGYHAIEEKAQRAWEKAEEALHAGRLGDPQRGKQTFRAYVESEWLPHHVIEATTREGYVYLLRRHIMPTFGGRRMREILPLDVRQWVVDLQKADVQPPTIRNCKVILDAILTTALNDQIVFLHAGRGVKTPPVARKPKRIVTAEQFQRIHAALGDDTMRLLVELDIESGLRWGELTELRPKDLDATSGLLTVARAVVHLKAKDVPDDRRFVVKPYPKDKEWRQIGLAPHIVAKIVEHIEQQHLQPEDLLFSMPAPACETRRRRPAVLPDPATLGLTEPSPKGRQYAHGTLSAYQAARCRCQHCKDAVAAYRAERRAAGKDEPRGRRTVLTDGHISNSWFRTQVWQPAIKAADLPFHVTPHGLRHAHASWLLAGGADLQVVKERLGHGSITTTEGYLHSLPDAHDAALAALDAIRGISPATSSDDCRDRPTLASDGDPDPRDTELAELRGMVAQFRALLDPPAKGA